MQIGFIGLGQMGAAMAANLIDAGFEVIVWNRNREKMEPHVAKGAKAAASPAEAAIGDLVVTMLADDIAVERVVFADDGISEANALHISMSTISPKLVERLAANAPGGFVSAPVFGRPEAAALAKLFVIAAGPAVLLERCAPLFAAVGQRTFHVGEEPVAANIVKLCGNFSLMAMVEAMAEAMVLAERNGVDKAVLAEVMSQTLFPGGAYANYCKLLIDNRFIPAGFPAVLGLKDIQLVSEAASASYSPMPVLSILRDHFLALMAQGDGEIDWAGLARIPWRQAGLE